MQIVMCDGRRFGGTPVQIVQAMQDIAFGCETMSLREYIDFCVNNADGAGAANMQVAGETDEEYATSFVFQLVRSGLAQRA